MWKIDRDYINDGRDDIPSRVGVSGDKTGGDIFGITEVTKLDDTGEKIRFRMLDDDGEVYYGGWLHDDDDCLNQIEASRFGEHDAGAIWIEVKRDGEWVQEIS